eukprot:762890-Pleurochrysis_carterae.AAC.3
MDFPGRTSWLFFYAIGWKSEALLLTTTCTTANNGGHLPMFASKWTVRAVAILHGKPTSHYYGRLQRRL